MRIIRLALAMLLPIFVVGCANVNEMAINKKSKDLDLHGKSLLLMNVHIENKYKTGYQPQVIVVNVEKPNAKQKSDRQNFKVDLEGGQSGKGGNDYLVRMLIEPGQYVIRGMTGMSTGFLVIANFFAPMHEDVVAEPNKIVYLGKVNATVRERVGEEFRAGAVTPLIDQAVAGFSGGTFDVEIIDNYDQDVTAFKSNFSVLQSATIEKQILEKFDRNKAQQWWSAQ
jgi:hypothetical protein